MRQSDRLSGVDRFGTRKFFQIALDQIGDAQKDLRSFLGRRPGPVDECFFRRGDGKIDIFLSAVGNLRIRLAGGGLDVVEKTSADGLNKLAVNKILDLRKFSLHFAKAINVVEALVPSACLFRSVLENNHAAVRQTTSGHIIDALAGA